MSNKLVSAGVQSLVWYKLREDAQKFGLEDVSYCWPEFRAKTRERVLNIPAHTLFEEYPAKIPEAEIKPMDESGEIVLRKVVVPEYVVVHNGVPSDPTAQNYWVTYKDYIKNVASSEIYATWPASTIRANVLAIMSFTLNRVYTEW